MLLLSLYYDNMNTELGKKKHIFVEKCRFYVSQNNGTLSEIVRSLMLAPKHVFVFLRTMEIKEKTRENTIFRCCLPLALYLIL
jgi:hypothetical protein